MGNLYLYTLEKAKRKTKVRQIVFDRLLTNNDCKKIGEVVSIFDSTLTREMKKMDLKTIFENKENGLKT
jgi:hypothetical protein